MAGGETATPRPGPGRQGIIPAVTTCYLAARGFAADLLDELALQGVPVRRAAERLVITDAPPVEAFWAQNVWRDCFTRPFSSISEAAGALKAVRRKWAKYSICCHRRAELIQQALPRYGRRPLRFLQPLPAGPVGSWTLPDAATLLASADCSNPLPNGEVEFEEDHEAPPSRAYLKLWELFTVHGFRPAPGETCLDLGSAPGGWTWVLQGLGCRVISVDKAPLEPRIARLPGVQWRQQSAFALEPREAGAVDWLFSDVICYPDRLYALVMRWLEAGAAANLVCTIKFQGATDHAAVRRFAAIPGSRIVHLYHNRHELTWYRLAPPEASSPGVFRLRGERPQAL